MTATVSSNQLELAQCLRNPSRRLGRERQDRERRRRLAQAEDAGGGGVGDAVARQLVEEVPHRLQPRVQPARLSFVAALGFEFIFKFSFSDSNILHFMTLLML